MKTRPLLIIGLLLALLAAACGAGTASPSPADTADPPSQVPATPAPTAGDTAATTQAPAAPSATTTAPEAAPQAPATEGPAAPDFSLDLADGSQFVLSDEQKPVYLVFWAEW